MPLEIALSGINAASSQLEVISNNIANNATNGFKRSSTEFADVYAVTNGGASDTQTGAGVRVTQVTQEFTQGDMTYTENDMDLAISGEGFFRMESSGEVVYTRAGTFGLDEEGYIVNSSGDYLTGYQVNDDDELTSTIGPILVDSGSLAPNATSEIDLGLNLDATAETPDDVFDVNSASSYNFSTSTSIYDSLGYPHEATVYFRKEGAKDWTSYTYVDDQQVSTDTLTFNEDGTLESLNGVAGEAVISTAAYTPDTGAAAQSFTLDLADTTQFENPFGVNEVYQDGYEAGRLSSVEIDSTGVVYGIYTNREAKPMGQITLTNFSNPQGLSPVGDTSWAETFDSGAGATGAPGSASLGLLQSGALEASNVDITEELVAMIGAQRSFQANAQVIGTADTLSQTVINIRR
ncbi:flagellar hook protein FlgE [Granulosicoccaceae sp. 1_MG-2023]|nr:flagellar hook protein FlgE [Granulosicoccaceae sp. 1_MG-2023]